MKYNGIIQIYQKIEKLNFGFTNSINKTNFEWIELIKNSRKLGFSSNYILSINLLSNPKNSSMYILMVS